MKEEKKGSGFLSVLGLMCRLRLPYQGPFRFDRALIHIPIVGLIITILLVSGFMGLSALVPDPFIVILVLVVSQYLLFNLFHIDGLLDTADGLVPFAEKEKRLRILKDSNIGAFALFFGTVYIGAKLYFLTKGALYFYIVDVPGFVKWTIAVMFFSYPISGRTAAALVPLLAGPAKSEGLGAGLSGAKPSSAFWGLLLSHIPHLAFFVMAVYFYGAPSPLFLLACAGAPAGWLLAALLYKRKVGGYTGDTFGFAVEIGELFHIFIFFILLLFGFG